MADGFFVSNEPQNVSRSSEGPRAAAKTHRYDTLLLGLNNARPGFLENLEISYPVTDIPGSTYDPARESISFMVECQPDINKEVDLILFEQPEVHSRYQVVPMRDFGDGRFGVTIKGDGVKPGLLYALKPRGPGHDPSDFLWLVDPYARALVRGDMEWLMSKPRIAGVDDPYDTTQGLPPVKYNATPSAESYIPPKSVVVHMPDEALPRLAPTPVGKQVIYEMHVQDTRTFPDSLIPDEQAHFRGKQGTLEFLQCPAFIEQLKLLNVTHLQLMPIQFRGLEWSLASWGMKNEWNYNPISFMAVEPDYCASKDPQSQILELRESARTLAANKIQLALDLVLGHTHEGAPKYAARDLDPIRRCEKGPTTSLRALYPSQYYHGDDDATGCGHTFNASSELGRKLVVTAVKHWSDLGVTAARYDQGTVLGLRRNERWELVFDKNAPVLKDILNMIDTPVVEPNHIGPNNQAVFHCNEFPEPWQEWNYAYKELTRGFFGGEDWAPIRIISDLLAGSGRHIKHASNHDALPTWDVTEEMFKHLVEAGVYPQNLDPAEMVRNRVELARAVLANVIFSPGSLMISRGNERLRSQDSRRNPFADPRYIGLEWDFDKNTEKPGYPTPAQKESFLNFTRSAMQLRQALGCFATDKRYLPDELSWYRASGKNMDEKVLELMSSGLSGEQAAKESWNGRGPGQFIGALYTLRPERHEEAKNPVYVAIWNGNPGEIVLPRANSGYEWQMCLNTVSGEVYTSDPDNKPGLAVLRQKVEGEIRQVFFAVRPGLALFQKRKVIH